MSTPVKATLAVVALLLSAGAASADDASKKAMIEEIFQVTKADRLIEQMVDQLRSTQPAQIGKMDKAARPRAEAEQNRMGQSLSDRTSWNRLRPRLITLYEQTFTEEELDGALTFYKSQAGRAWMQKMPVLMGQMMMLAGDMMVEAQPEIQSVRPSKKK